MGRCYEFGVEIHAGCEQAMVVTAEGGSCECTTCATTCPGRFSGCAAIVVVPGRIPTSAPSWAVPGGDASTREDRRDTRMTRRAIIDDADSARAVEAVVGAGETVGDGSLGGIGDAVPAASAAMPVSHAGGAANGGAPADAEAPMDEVLARLGTLVQHHAAYPAASMVEAVDALRAEVRDRDVQLAASLEAYAAFQLQLSTEITRVGVAVDALPTDVAEQLRRFGEVVNRLTTEVSGELSRISTAVERLTASVRDIELSLARPTTPPSLRDLLGRKATS